MHVRDAVAAFVMCSSASAAGSDGGLAEAQRFIALAQAASDAVTRAAASVDGHVRSSVAAGLAKLSTQVPSVWCSPPLGVICAH